jgi:NADH-quinone oxidoreductase subunit E
MVTKRSQLLKELWAAQKQHACVARASQAAIAKQVGLTEMEVREVMSFYTMFTEKPRAKHALEVCVGLCCKLRGADDIIAHLKEKLGIEIDATTPDGTFHLSTVECLGSCGTAPMMMIGDTYYEDLTKEKIDEIIKKIKK